MLSEKYDLELERAVKEIKNLRAKKVLLQFPEGLKPQATKVADFLEEKTNAEIFIWMGSCFGACDIPEVKKIDLLIQFGHAPWKFKKVSDK